MRAIIQRVSQARVEVEGQTIGQIGPGLLVYLGVGHQDGQEDIDFIAGKIADLRIFADDQGKMNRSVMDIGGSVLIVSQFTLYGDCRKGRRPGFDAAGEPQMAQQLYQQTCGQLRQRGLTVATGQFAAHMAVSSANDGPVTFILDSKKAF